MCSALVRCRYWGFPDAKLLHLGMEYCLLPLVCKAPRRSDLKRLPTTTHGTIALKTHHQMLPAAEVPDENCRSMVQCTASQLYITYMTGWKLSAVDYNMGWGRNVPSTGCLGSNGGYPTAPTPHDGTRPLATFTAPCYRRNHIVVPLKVADA